MSEGERHANSRPLGSRIDPYFDQYAERARGMVASEIRALFAVTARPEIVSLAGGSPYVTALPLDVVGNMVGQLVDRPRQRRTPVLHRTRGHRAAGKDL